MTGSDATAALRPGEGFADWFERRLRSLAPRTHVTIDRALTPIDAREAGVLAAFWREGDVVRLALTLRSEALSTHKGQVSLPGGRRDPDDVSIQAAALREAEEELGIPPETVEVLGQLDELFSIGNYIVAPTVGWLAQRPKMIPSPAEVERVIEADVERLMSPDIYRREEVTRGDFVFPVHYYDYDGDVVWGLTGAVLHGLFRLVRGEPRNAESDTAESIRRYLSRVTD